MTIEKKYLQSKSICEVIFKIPAKVGISANAANVVGEFNNWSFTAHPMKKLKSGAFTATLRLEKGRGYQFRYLLDGNKWENEADADKLVPSPFGDSENSVIIL